jgi:hypothetical protein
VLEAGIPASSGVTAVKIISPPHAMQRIMRTLTISSPQQKAGLCSKTGSNVSETHRHGKIGDQILATLRPKEVCPQYPQAQNLSRVARSEWIVANGGFGTARCSELDEGYVDIEVPGATEREPSPRSATEEIYSSSQPSSSRALHITSCAFALLPSPLFKAPIARCQRNVFRF